MGELTIEVVRVTKEAAKQLQRLQRDRRRADSIFIGGFFVALWFTGMMAYAAHLHPWVLLLIWGVLLTIPSTYSIPMLCHVIKRRNRILKEQGWSGKLPVQYNTIEA